MDARPTPPRAQPGAQRLRWCVLGAGPSGLVAMKELQEVGISTTCFDALPRIGGVFARGYDGLLMTSSSVMTAFSSHSDGGESEPRHWTGEEYLAYLEGFAARYGLTKDVRLGTRVLEVRRCPEGSGKWLVTHAPVASGGGSGGSDSGSGPSPAAADAATAAAANATAAAVTEAFDGVAVCVGTHQHPRAPPVAGADRFGGRVVHSSEVKDMSPFVGKRVAVIGAGESGSDLCRMISEVAAAVCVVVRGEHGHLIARNAAVGARRPNDMNTNRARYSNPPALGGAIEACISLGKRLQARLLSRRDPLAAEVMLAMLDLNAQQGTDPFSKYGSKSSGFVEAVVLRGARMHRGEYRLEKGRVVFPRGDGGGGKGGKGGCKGGEGELEGPTDHAAPPFEADVVLACTGFEQRLPFLEAGHPELAAKYANPRLLYKQVFTPKHGASFAFLGTARPAFGAIPPLSELQARCVALAATGALPLPPRGEMEAEAARDRAMWEARFPGDKAIRSLVDHQTYADSLAALLGALPPLGARALASDPALWLKLAFGPLAAAQYRLRGPGAAPEAARAALMRCPSGGWLEGGVSFAFLLLAKFLSGVLGLRRFRPLNF